MLLKLSTINNWTLKSLLENRDTPLITMFILIKVSELNSTWLIFTDANHAAKTSTQLTERNAQFGAFLSWYKRNLFILHCNPNVHLLIKPQTAESRHCPLKENHQLWALKIPNLEFGNEEISPLQKHLMEHRKRNSNAWEKWNIWFHQNSKTTCLFPTLTFATTPLQLSCKGKMP